jgi:hypothetical protein
MTDRLNKPEISKCAQGLKSESIGLVDGSGVGVASVGRLPLAAAFRVSSAPSSDIADRSDDLLHGSGRRRRRRVRACALLRFIGNERRTPIALLRSLGCQHLG